MSNQAGRAVELPTLKHDMVARWLRGLPPSAICGRTNSTTSCPLARYLQDLLGDECMVTGDRYEGPLEWLSPDFPQPRVAALPGWARLFVWAIDAEGREGSRLGQDIPACRALQLLEQSVESARDVGAGD